MRYLFNITEQKIEKSIPDNTCEYDVACIITKFANEYPDCEFKILTEDGKREWELISNREKKNAKYLEMCGIKKNIGDVVYYKHEEYAIKSIDIHIGSDCTFVRYDLDGRIAQTSIPEDELLTKQEYITYLENRISELKG